MSRRPKDSYADDSDQMMCLSQDQRRWSDGPIAKWIATSEMGVWMYHLINIDAQHRAMQSSTCGAWIQRDGIDTVTARAGPVHPISTWNLKLGIHSIFMPWAVDAYCGFFIIVPRVSSRLQSKYKANRKQRKNVKKTKNCCVQQVDMHHQGKPSFGAI